MNTLTKSALADHTKHIGLQDDGEAIHPGEVIGDSTIERPLAYLNRNLQNYPLARDRRLKLHWWQSKTTKRWLCNLTDNIQLRLPATTAVECRVCPNAFDINVLLHFVMLRRKTGRPDLRLTAKGLLKAIELARDGANQKRLRSALQLWSNLSIYFRHWHADKKGQPHLLRPPIKEIKAGRPLQITMNEGWIWKSGFYTKIPLPLPGDAVAQNLILYVLTQPQRKGKRDRRSLYTKLGLTHSNSTRSMEHSIDLAQKWFRRHSGNLQVTTKRDRFSFRAHLPEHQTAKQKQATQKQKIVRTRLSFDEMKSLKEEKEFREACAPPPKPPKEEMITRTMETGETKSYTRAQWAQFDAGEFDI